MVRRVVSLVGSVSIVLALSAGGTVARSGTLALTIVANPQLRIVLWPAEVYVGQETSITFRIDNPNSTLALENVGFAMTLPAALSIPAGSVVTCGGVIKVDGQSISMVGAHVAAGGSCQYMRHILALQAGTWTLTTTRVTSSNAGMGKSASDTLTVKAVPTVPPAPQGPDSTVAPAASEPSQSPSASPSPSPAETAEASATAQPADAPAAAGSTGGDSTPWLPIAVVAALTGALCGLAAAGGLLLVARMQRRPRRST